MPGATGIPRDRANLTPKQARAILNEAVRHGRVIPPSTCDRCGLEAELIQAHHRDYKRPLDVEWLCSNCHSAEHNPPPAVPPGRAKPMVQWRIVRDLRDRLYAYALRTGRTRTSLVEEALREFLDRRGA